MWAAGNVADPMAGVITAAAAGARAAADINMALVADDTARAMDPFTAASEAALSGSVLGGRRHGLNVGAP